MHKTSLLKAVFIFLLAFWMPAGFSTVSWAVPEESKAIQQLEAQEKAAPVKAIQRPRVDYTADKEPDPFALPPEPVKKPGEAQAGGASKSKEVSPPTLSVKGIVWGGRFPQAIVNDRVVKEGDIVEEARITKIEKTGVTVFFQGSEFTLPVQNYQGGSNGK